MAEGYGLKYGVVIVAAGSGTRMGSGIPKQFRMLAGLPVLGRTINLFAEAVHGIEIAVVLPQERLDFWRNFAARFDIAPHKCVAGGAERTLSVRAGLAALSPAADIIAVHDGVRPLTSPELIRRVFECAAEHGTAVPAIEPSDSCRTLTGRGGSRCADRSQLRLVQTPQAFNADILRSAYDSASGSLYTDDASLVESCGTAITLCQGERTNLKLTAPGDFAVAEALLQFMTGSHADDSSDI